MSIDKELSSHRVGRGMLLLASKDIVGSIISAVFFVLIARFIPSVADLGVLISLQTIIIMFVILSGLGLPYTANRFISSFLGSGKKERAHNLYPLIFTLSAGLSSIFSVILFVLSSEFSIVLFNSTGYTSLIQLTSIEVLLLGLVTTCTFLLTASLEFKKVALVSMVTSIIKYGCSFVFLALGLGLYGIILGLVIGDSISLAVFSILLRSKILKWSVNISSSISQLKVMLRFSLPLYGSEILSFFSFRIDVYLLMALSNSYMVGIYSPAVFIEGAFFILLTALDQALLPAVSRVYGRSGISSFKISSRYVTRYLFLLYFPLGFALIASTPSIVNLALGDRFTESIIPIMILLMSITLTSPFIVVYSLLRSSGNTDVLLKSSALSLLVQILISVITIPSTGVLGVSVAKFASRFILLVFPTRSLKKIGGFEIDVNALKNGLVGSSVVSLVIIIINTFIGPYSVPVQYISAFISLLIFFRYTRAIDKFDLELIEKILPGKMKLLTIHLAKLLL